MKFRALLCSLLAMSLSSVACRNISSEDAAPLRIVSVQVGIPPGPHQGDEQFTRRTEPLVKVGHWTPVVVTVTGQGRIDRSTLVIQTTDCDDALHEVHLSIPAIEFTPSEPERLLIGYCRPGKTNASVTVSIQSPASSAAIRLADEPVSGLDPRSFLYCTLGPRLPLLRLPSHETERARNAEVASWDKASFLPTRWLGYDSVDLAIWCTSDEEFSGALLHDSTRREALREWVRRGGNLVICVGRHHTVLQNQPELRDFFPVDFVGTQNVPMVNVQWPGSAVLDELGDAQRQQPLTLAVVRPKADVQIRRLATARIEGGGELPLVVQAPYGRGRLTIVTVDADQPPFTQWKRQGDFWERLLRDAGPKLIATSPSQSLVASESTDNLQRHLQNSLESFDSVPVISFSWVALFLLIYIIAIGPLDYFLLKKIAKRLEWTWVTFPLLVVTVSLGAYVAARTFKGKVQRIQKVDLIDYDLVSHTAVGHSWFAVFSPKNESFNLEVIPSKSWGCDERLSPPVVAALGEARGGRQTLFRRSYRFDADSGILGNVPIPVWSVKSFEAQWHDRWDASSAPLMTNLRLVGDDITGSIASRLPARLQRVTLLHRNSVYQLGNLDSGQTLQVTPAARSSFRDWFTTKPGGAPRPTDGMFTPWSQPPVPPPTSAGRVVRQLLFHELWEAGSTLAATPRNAGFRRLDQSWRLSLDDPGASAIVYAQVEPRHGSLTEINKSDHAPSQLRVRSSSSSEDAESAMTGWLLQETYLRFFVPVKITP